MDRIYFSLKKISFIRILLALSFLFPCLTVKSQDHSLEYFLQQGLKNSPLLKDIQIQIGSGKIDSMLIKAMNNPKVEFRGYAFYAPIINHFGYSEVLTNLANLTSVMSVSQPLFNKKTVAANILKNDIQKHNLANTVRLTENNLKKTITSQYLDIYATYSEISVNLELLSFAKDQGKILKSLTENGIYKQTDYLSFGIDIQGQELQIQELNLQFRRQISDLYLLCGLKDTGIFSPVKPELATPFRMNPENSPSFLRFYIDSLRITNENLLIDRNYKPSVSWFADAGLINNDPTVIYQNFGLSLGLNFTFPVYDGNQRKLNHQKLKAEEEIRVDYKLAFKQEYDQQLQQWKDELNLTEALLPAVREQVGNTEMLVKQEKELVNRGSGSITDYLIAVKNYLSVRKSLTQYEIRILQIRNEITYWK
jgi:outer membrane protein TolC